MFPCQRWLAKDEEDGAIERELVADKVLDEVVRRDGTVKTKELQRRNTLSCNCTLCCVVSPTQGRRRPGSPWGSWVRTTQRRPVAYVVIVQIQ